MRIPDPTKPLSTFSGGQRQGVAVARAVMWASKVVIMDEPTAALGVAQVGMVLDLVRQVRQTGIPVVFISHNMPQVFDVADRIVVAAWRWSRSSIPRRPRRTMRWRP